MVRMFIEFEYCDKYGNLYNFMWVWL